MAQGTTGGDATEGLVVVDKPAGWTSHDVVARMRRIYGLKRVGHAGTLDPDATGVLLVGLGRATRLLRFLTETGRAPLRRIVAFARPHRRALVAFLILSVISAVLAVATPVLAGWVVDDIIKHKAEGRVLFLAGLIAVVAVLDAVIGIAERWQSSKIGEGLILDLRRAVFGHIQRMPVAFFTRTRTGALVSRLNNDVIGAQRAFTWTLSGVVSNTISLVLTLVVMLGLSWQVTVLAL